LIASKYLILINLENLYELESLKKFFLKNFGGRLKTILINFIISQYNAV